MEVLSQELFEIGKVALTVAFVEHDIWCEVDIQDSFRVDNYTPNVG
jgi:hypothetical protein